MRTVRFLAVLVALLLAVSLPPAARADIPPGAEWRIVTAGEAVVGEKLQAGVSNLLPTDGRAGQWFADGAAIAGATTGGLVLTSEQLGAVIHFEAVITRAGHDPVTLVSQPFGPVVAGQIRLYSYVSQSPLFPGDTAEVITSPALPVGTTARYQWRLDGTPVAGANQATLGLSRSMVGKSLGVVVTAEGAGYNSATTTVSAGVVLGSVVPGETQVWADPSNANELHVSDYGWEPSGDVKLEFQWLLDGAALVGRTGRSLFLHPEWEGRSVSVSVTGSAGRDIAPTTKTSAPVRIRRAPADLPAIYIASNSGPDVPAREREWSADPRGLPAETTFTYQWFHLSQGKEVPIPGATKATHRLTETDFFKDVIVRATATTPDGQRLNLRSDPAQAWVDVYTTPGHHFYNDREWRTSCEPYSRTTRCRTDIRATTVTADGGRYVKSNDWVFNNLTYLPSEAKLWQNNPLAHPGQWQASDGRRWKTECFASTLPHTCRSFVWTHYIGSAPARSGWRYFPTSGWVFNNQVHVR